MPRTVSVEKKANDPNTGVRVNDALSAFHPVTARWFRKTLGEPTAAQRESWPVIARGESTLVLAPTGTGKTLAAFLWCIDRLMMRSASEAQPGCRVVYVSPLKALAVDVERNLREPLAGIVQLAGQEGIAVRIPEINLRTGDTPQRERARFKRHPGKILITTPESLYLMLTSEAVESLRTVETVIVDEIHTLVPVKRGAHLALSLERLEMTAGRRLQRIGLSATQRPLEEVARFLGGVEELDPCFEDSHISGVRSEVGGELARTLVQVAGDDGDEDASRKYRAITIVDAGTKKPLELRVEVPVEDMARLNVRQRSTDADGTEAKQTSIWQSIYPRLLELVREHRSTMIFVNARRTAERLAGALNELAGEPLARAHHGSLAATQRAEIEDLLKSGRIQALVATSSLELGIDMGAVDLVVQIEAPPSVAAGMQRIGRAAHKVGMSSRGVIFPKYRADLVACASATRAMHEGQVESTHYLRNPLDVLAQQIVAIVARPPTVASSAPWMENGEDTGISYDALYTLVRRAAPFAGLCRSSFDGVLDMLSGRYPSDEFAELRPRITWDRTHHWLTPRSGSKRLAVLNAGTIPDRGLYGVFLKDDRAKPVRVGELDEEMVFESKPGDVFTLGASSWRIQEITRDRVLVSPAPGNVGKMPFWHGDRAGRPLEFGQRIGKLVRELLATPRNAGVARLTTEHDLTVNAAENLLRYLTDQAEATAVVPDDCNIVIERVRDELGFWRVCVLSPFGSRVHAPWAVAAAARVRASGGPDVEAMWSEDGFVLRFPETDDPPPVAPLLLRGSEAAELVIQQLGTTALFAARFRESAARALLLPRRRADGRTPLWQQRKHAYDLLSVASRYASFPILLETYRECLRDVFDMRALAEILRGIDAREIHVHTVDTRAPSSFASAVLFSYVANYIYDGDAPLAERRAQALTIDREQLRELMGEADLRELLDARAIQTTEKQLQGLADGYSAHSMDGVHDLLLRVGDLSREELRARCASNEVANGVTKLLRARRVIAIQVAGEERLIAVEDAARYRDGLGVTLGTGIPAAFLVPAQDAIESLLRRFARTHGPFSTGEVAQRFGIGVQRAEVVLKQMMRAGLITEGGFIPQGNQREWCDMEVLQTIRRRSLARLRKEIEPVDQNVLARLIARWQGVAQPRRGLDALLDAVENLQGTPLPASILETEILPARIREYKPADLDKLMAANEVVWCGVEPLGEHDGRVSLYLTEKLPALWSPMQSMQEKNSEREEKILVFLREHGASFFTELHEGTGAGYPGETTTALWSLLWKGLVVNDGMAALRAYVERPARGRSAAQSHVQTGYRSRRALPPKAQGRWSLLRAALQDEGAARGATRWSHAIARQLLTRYGVVVRETAHAEGLPGGFSAIYDVLKELEENGSVRRGYFVDALGATQFAVPGAVDLLRSLRVPPDDNRSVIFELAATDPANPYGSLLPWPDKGMVLTRSVGARVILHDGDLVLYRRRENPHVQIFLPEEEPQRSRTAACLARFLVEQAQTHEDQNARGGLLISTINGLSVAKHWMARYLIEAGFHAGASSFNVRRQSGPSGTAQKRAY